VYNAFFPNDPMKGKADRARKIIIGCHSRADAMWRGQTGFFRYNDYYSSLSVMRGCLSGFKHAAALMSEPSQRMQRSQFL
jgi:hypothetical protein